MNKVCRVREGLHTNFRELGNMTPDEVMNYASANGYESMGVYFSKVWCEQVKLYIRCDEHGTILSQLLVSKA